ncbi:MAG: PDZ domain-containing protein [Acidobacteriota bacterium]|nr:PDZ domain-containing protein [Acidobacteriota bacterium]
MKRFLCCILTLIAANAFALDEKGYMGVNLETWEEKGKAPVVRIGKVYKDSGAAVAGVKEGDIIVGFQGVDIQSSKELTDALESYGPGDVVTLTVKRDDETLDLDLELGEMPAASWVRSGDKWIGYFNPDRAYVGVDLMELNEQLAEYFGVAGGVLIQSVRKDSPAADAGLKAGDVVVRVGEHDVATSRDLTKALANYKSGDAVNFDVVRKGQNKSMKVTAESWKDAYGGVQFHNFNFNFSPDIQWKGLEELELRGLEGLKGLESLKELRLEGLDLKELEALRELRLPEGKGFKFEFDRDKLKSEMETLREELNRLKEELKKKSEKEKNEEQL